MRFRPCIDIHNGKVKQIVGGSLLDKGNQAVDNYVSEQDASFYASLYRDSQLRGGHIIILNPAGSQYYDEDIRQAQLALQAFPNGLQIGGGITAENAKLFLEKGATHVIVTSYAFKDGEIQMERLHKLTEAVGREHIVLDLSCRKCEGKYYIVTDRWQKFTNVIVNHDILNKLSVFCDEFLIHAVDVEGKASGVELELVKMLGKWGKIPVTYAGGVGSYADLEQLKKLGQGCVDVTIGSALDLFGGRLKYEEVLKYCNGTER